MLRRYPRRAWSTTQRLFTFSFLDVKAHVLRVWIPANIRIFDWTDLELSYYRIVWIYSFPDFSTSFHTEWIYLGGLSSYINSSIQSMIEHARKLFDSLSYSVRNFTLLYLFSLFGRYLWPSYHQSRSPNPVDSSDILYQLSLLMSDGLRHNATDLPRSRSRIFLFVSSIFT